MPVTIRRAASKAHPAGFTRADVKVGQVFRVRNRSGARGTETYAAIGRNGKHFSVNLRTGALASTKRGDRPVTLVGTFKYNTMISPTATRETTRGQVREGEVFRVKGGTRLYGHIGMATEGERTPRAIGVTFDTLDNSTTADMNKKVIVCGKWEIVQD